MAKKTPTFPSFYGNNELKSWNPGPESQLFIPASINVYHFSQKKKKKKRGGGSGGKGGQGRRERNKCCSPTGTGAARAALPCSHGSSTTRNVVADTKCCFICKNMAGRDFLLGKESCECPCAPGGQRGHSPSSACTHLPTSPR